MRWCQYRTSPARSRCGLGFCGSTNIGDGTGHGDSDGSGGIVLYEVDVGEGVEDEWILVGSGVGRKDRGDQGLGDDNDGSV